MIESLKKKIDVEKIIYAMASEYKLQNYGKAFSAVIGGIPWRHKSGPVIG